ncbi:hypothetical protein HDU79_010004 [Rhizoclosmatium sp. JEL0117]|nr:hypothetical protein HDU79_010004 [Rhizoclosmatium sp. JEL0117]
MGFFDTLNKARTQVYVISFVCFLCPGMFNALNSLPTAGPSAQVVKDKQNAALYLCFAIMGLLAGVLGSLAAGAAAGSYDYNEKGGKQRMLAAERKSNRADSPDSTDANATKKSSNAGKDGSIGAKDEKEAEEEQADRDENEVADTESLYSTISQVDDETILERCLQELLQASESMSIDRARLFFLQNIAVMIPYKMIDKHLITAAHMSLSPSQRERLNHMALSTPVLLAKLFLASKMRSQFSVFVLFVSILLLCIETNPVLDVHTLSTIFWIECCCMSVFVYEIIVQRICIQTRLWQAVRNVSSPYVDHIFMLFEVIYESITMRPTSTVDSLKQHIVTVNDDESQLDDNKIKYKYLDTDENRWLWLIIDVLATLPFFVELGIRAFETVQIGGDFTTFLIKMYSWSEARVEIQFLRLFRVVRLFKAGQKSEKVSSYMAREQFNHKVQLRIIIRAILNATDVAETVTTVGFGDIYPKTGIGRLVMAIVMFLSFFVIAFPLCMITMEYTHYARLFTEKRRGHEVDARILRERLLASSVSRSSEERENPTAVKNPESVNQAVTATVEEQPIIEPREEQEMTQSDSTKPKLIITLTEDPIPVSEPETTPLKTPIPDSEPITTKRQFHAPGRSFSSPDFDMTKANSLFSDLDTELDIESDTASIQPHKAGHTEKKVAVVSSKSSLIGSMLFQRVFAAAAFFAAAVLAGKNEPPAGKVILGIWMDGTSGKVSGNDTSARVADRLGYNPGSYQIWQMMPPYVEDPEFLPLLNADGTSNFDGVINEGTDASIFWTIYPRGFNVTDQDMTNVLNQGRRLIDTTGRKLFIRLGPEMNGDWFSYGGKPTQFVALWQRFYTLMQTITPDAALVWAPNYDGCCSNTPYAPYWPGADYVDWVGISMYWKGFFVDWPWHVNKVPPPDYAQQVIDTGSEGGPVSLYNEYAVKYNKPFCIAETGAAWGRAFQSDTGVVSAMDPGPGQVAIQMGFWNGFLFNATFYKQYPLVKMIHAFEIYKVEDGVQRDYRATFEPTLTPFKAGLAKMDALGLMAWAKDISQPATATKGAAATGTPVVTTKSAGFSVGGTFAALMAVLALV